MGIVSSNCAQKVVFRHRHFGYEGSLFYRNWGTLAKAALRQEIAWKKVIKFKDGGTHIM